jgi:hypothetical protein
MLYGSTITLIKSTDTLAAFDGAQVALVKAIADKKKECVALFKTAEKTFKAVKKKGSDVQALMQQVAQDPIKFATDNNLMPYMNACSVYQNLQGQAKDLSGLQDLIKRGYSVTIALNTFVKIDRKQFGTDQGDGLGQYVTSPAYCGTGGGVFRTTKDAGVVTIPTPDNDFGSSAG